MNNFFYIWIIISLLCVFLEIGHPGLFLFLSFAIGAVITAISVYFVDSLETQCIIFLLASMGSLIGLIKWVQQAADHDFAYNKTNTQALIGRSAFVVQGIYPDSPGEVKIGGELWMARGVRNQEIEVGTHVVVVQVQGAHVVVEPKETE